MAESSINQFNIAWEKICVFSRVNLNSMQENRLWTTDINQAIAELCSIGLTDFVVDWFIDEFQNDLNDNIIPQFWSYFQSKRVPQLAFENFGSAVENLTTAINWYRGPASVIDDTGDATYRRIADLGKPFHSLSDMIDQLPKALLLVGVPLYFHNEVILYCSKAFKAFHSIRNEVTIKTTLDETVCFGCENELISCSCATLLQEFRKTNQLLQEVNLLEALVSDAILTAARHHIDVYVQTNCKGNFEKFYKKTLEEWLGKTVFGWLDSAFCLEEIMSEEKTPKCVTKYRELLSYYLVEKYALVRTDQLFNIIIEFPDSQAALEDLRDCLEKTNLRSKLIGNLKKSLETRLLHPGVNTEDILTAYISAIKALRVLDPTGVILQLTSQPVCKYLRSRDDTVRCIVSSLIDDSNSELMSELMRGAPLLLGDGCGNHSDDEDDIGVAGDWENWQPDPIDADPGKAPRSHRSSDIISILVNIYGTKELFVKEYQGLLADRLLMTFCFDTGREIRYLELLKLRFGEAHLHYCEVMLKDVADSKRINSNVNNAEAVEKRTSEEFPVDAMIVSAQFWPTLREERIELPAIVQTAFDGYTKAFEALKGNRTLTWKPSLGLVQLEIELKDRTLDLQVFPIQAVIIWHFQEKPRWTIEELSQAMGSPTSVLRRKITLWQSHGVLKEEENDMFVLVEERTKGAHAMIEETVMEEEEGDVITASTKEQKEEELQASFQMYWSFIVGMLTNLDSLPLEQIHNMLRMFAMQGPNATEWNIHELRQFLNQKVSEEKLIYTNGLYRLLT